MVLPALHPVLASLRLLICRPLLCRLNVKCLPQASAFEYLFEHSQPVGTALFWEVVELLGGVA